MKGSLAGAADSPVTKTSKAQERQSAKKATLLEKPAQSNPLTIQTRAIPARRDAIQVRVQNHRAM